MQYFNGLNMGEGIAGPSNIGAATTVIYSCMGIAFVNRQKSFGGLYHYPAKSLDNKNVVSTIQQMFNDLQPDEIVLTPAQSTGPGMGSDVEDIDESIKFLKALGNQSHKVTRANPRSLAVLTWTQNGTPVFNEVPGDQEERNVDQRYRSTMSTGRRELEGNIWYYGGDGETPGVLEQGLKTTKEGAKRRCIIL